MQIDVPNAIAQTATFIFLFSLAIVLSAKWTKRASLFDRSLTDELKGFAILAIILSHIGYFLVTDHDFLFPISVLAGVGVNMFLFLSGFGLASTSMNKDSSALAFYKKRLTKIYLPFWLVVSILFLVDFFIIGKHYPSLTIFQTYLGFFPEANLYQNLDSPLWYFSMIVFYYLLFPIFFRKKIYLLSPILIFLITYFITEKIYLPVTPSILSLYKVHLLSFPLGIAAALLNTKVLKGRNINPFKSGVLNNTLKTLSLALLGYIVAYTAINSGVGQDIKIEQLISLVTTFCIVAIFDLLPINFRIFSLFGLFSYEIYLFHWPLIYRYDFLYVAFPAYLATLMYLGVFLVIAIYLNKLIRRFT
jgi:peptidoglycan/LPS O-acetylase OafA/YrhL